MKGRKTLTPLLKSIEPRAIKCLAQWDGITPPHVDVDELKRWMKAPIVNLWYPWGYLLYVCPTVSEGGIISVKVPTKKGFITLSGKVMTKRELKEFIREVKRR